MVSGTYSSGDMVKFFILYLNVSLGMVTTCLGERRDVGGMKGAVDGTGRW